MIGHVYRITIAMCVCPQIGLNETPEPTTFAVTSRAIERFTERKYRPFGVLLHEPRQRRSWFIFDVRPYSRDPMQIRRLFHVP
jgi:hypothetical protein